MKRRVERPWQKWPYQRWVAWSVMPVFLSGIGTMLLLQRRLGVQSENPIEDASLFVGFGAFAAVGSILKAKRPGNPIGRIMAVAVGLPSAVAIAVLRYRLYEIDRIISRTVSYAVVAALVAAVYVAGVFVVQSIIPADEPSDLAVAGSTLVAAALFLPLRRRVQEWVDRRFNRSRYDATRTVEALGRRLRDQLQLSDLQGVSYKQWRPPRCSRPASPSGYVKGHDPLLTVGSSSVAIWLK